MFCLQLNWQTCSYLCSGFVRLSKYGTYQCRLYILQLWGLLLFAFGILWHHDRHVRVSWWSEKSCVLVIVSVTNAALSRIMLCAPCPTPKLKNQGPFVVHAVWPLACNQSGLVRPDGLLQRGVVYPPLSSRSMWWSNTSQSLLGSTWLQIKASYYPTGCCVVISACKAAMCLQAAGHILGGCCAQFHWETVWASRNVLMEITAEHMIASTSAVMLGPTSNNFVHAHTQSHTYTHMDIPLHVFTPQPQAKPSCPCPRANA